MSTLFQEGISIEGIGTNQIVKKFYNNAVEILNPLYGGTLKKMTNEEAFDFAMKIGCPPIIDYINGIELKLHFHYPEGKPGELLPKIYDKRYGEGESKRLIQEIRDNNV